MLQRLHHVERGDVRIENANIDAVNIPWLRAKLGWVTQVGQKIREYFLSQMFKKYFEGSWIFQSEHCGQYSLRGPQQTILAGTGH